MHLYEAQTLQQALFNLAFDINLKTAKSAKCSLSSLVDEM